MAHIVVIEDQEDLRRALQQMLHAEGHHVSLATDGHTGLQLVREHGPEVLLTDLFMPEIEGIEVIRTVRTQCPTVKIIAMSGGGRWQRRDTLMDAQLLGAHQTLAKPFTLQELRAALRAVLEEPAGTP